MTKKCYGITEGRTEGRTDGRTDGTTDRCKPVYPPLFQSGGMKTYLSIDINNVPGILKLSNVIIAQQGILLIGIKQTEVLHNDS